MIASALAARALRIGCSARRTDDPVLAHRDAADLLRHDDPAWALHYLTTRTEYGYVSTCALEVRDYLEDIGATDPEIVGPYVKRVGKAMIDVETVGVRHGAWARDLTAMPAVGDVVRIDNAERRNAHVLIVSDVDAQGVIHSIDGGQTDGTWTLARRRILVCPSHKGGRPYLVDPDAPYRADGEPDGREVTGRIDGAVFARSVS